MVATIPEHSGHSGMPAVGWRGQQVGHGLQRGLGSPAPLLPRCVSAPDGTAAVFCALSRGVGLDTADVETAAEG